MNKLAMTLCLGCTSLTLGSRALGAQSADDIRAYGALISTPIGALTPMSTAPAPGGHAAHNLSLRYAHYSETGLSANTIGATASMTSAKNAHSLTLGYRSCDGCDGLFMAGVTGRHTLWSAASGSHTTSLGLSGSGGWGHQKDVTALSLALSVPIGVAMEQANKSRLAAFVTPGFGWGHSSVKTPAGTSSGSGTRPLIGAGASWTSPGGIGVHVGFQKVIIDNGGNSVGAGLSWRHAM